MQGPWLISLRSVTPIQTVPTGFSSDPPTGAGHSRDRITAEGPSGDAMAPSHGSSHSTRNRSLRQGGDPRRPPEDPSWPRWHTPPTPQKHHLNESEEDRLSRSPGASPCSSLRWPVWQPRSSSRRRKIGPRKVGPHDTTHSGNAGRQEGQSPVHLPAASTPVASRASASTPPPCSGRKATPRRGSPGGQERLHQTRQGGLRFRW